jgi:hypothetical protein
MANGVLAIKILIAGRHFVRISGRFAGAVFQVNEREKRKFGPIN